MHMRGNAGGKVYERGNTNGTNIANEGAYYVRVIYILYKVRVYVYAKPRVKSIVAPPAVAEVLVEEVDGHHAHAAWQTGVQFLAHAAFKHLHNVGDGWVVGHVFVGMILGVSPVLAGFSAVLAQFPPSTARVSTSRGGLVVVLLSISR